jgi:pilus assembly protein CpaC
LIQDKNKGTLSRNIEGAQNVVSNGVVTSTPAKAGITLTVTPIIKSERSGLVELNNLNVTVDSGSKSEPNASTNVSTTISVRDRQSAAFAGVIKKANDTGYGAPANENAIITFNASKEYTRNNSQFVVFVTPIIKSSASTGVEQIKKKFRLRD